MDVVVSSKRIVDQDSPSVAPSCCLWNEKPSRFIFESQSSGQRDLGTVLTEKTVGDSSTESSQNHPDHDARRSRAHGRSSLGQCNMMCHRVVDGDQEEELDSRLRRDRLLDPRVSAMAMYPTSLTTNYSI